MRILFVTNPAQGHFFPMVPLAWALRAAGHDVLVASPAALRPEILAAGLPAAVTGGEFDMIAAMRPDRGDGPPTRATDPAVVTAQTAQGFAKLTRRAVDEVVSLVLRWRPALVIAEPTAQSGPIAAQRLGVPWVEHRWGLALSSQLMAILRQEVGQGDQAPPALVVDVCPPGFQFPAAAAAWSMRYVPYNGAAGHEDWMVSRERRRILVTLGTVLPRYGDASSLRSLLSSLVATAREHDAEVLLGIDPADASRLGLSADGVRAAAWLPLGLALPSCDAVVHHGGSGTTMTSLARGVPQLALPHFADQFANAGRLAETGAGLSLPPDRLPALGESLARLLSEPSFAATARAFAEENAKQPTPAETVERIVALC
ncbi:DUF1205 domain-containing protein [Dactylosporangium sp. AC04546]|uniref:nucleotide disphospho-sugar-binding domain-containing protein n=1 Tax=Dactylosporangium sp. AC04546 TaxID=2862460 RepID=UPI001EDEC43E|nr:nucleotide disphospho-sugar-binding domain-containing protein [Dactylosporangium sp. AC04546]WVK79048.1 DUF1205 domain-containing protein [Dactylosporangium sp. AC04546]